MTSPKTPATPDDVASLLIRLLANGSGVPYRMLKEALGVGRLKAPNVDAELVALNGFLFYYATTLVWPDRSHIIFDAYLRQLQQCAAQGRFGLPFNCRTVLNGLARYAQAASQEDPDRPFLSIGSEFARACRGGPDITYVMFAVSIALRLVTYVRGKLEELQLIC